MKRHQYFHRWYSSTRNPILSLMKATAFFAWFWLPSLQSTHRRRRDQKPHPCFHIEHKTFYGFERYNILVGAMYFAHSPRLTNIIIINRSNATTIIIIIISVIIIILQTCRPNVSVLNLENWIINNPKLRKKAKCDGSLFIGIIWKEFPFTIGIFPRVLLQSKIEV